MDIRFCDLCNESVPASDFALGRAFMRKGKVICASCERAMGGGSAGTDATTGRVAERAGSVGFPAAPGLEGATPGSSRASTAMTHHGGKDHHGGGAASGMGLDHEGPMAPQRASWAGAAALFVATGALAAAGTGGLLLAERLDRVEASVQATGHASLAAVDQVRRERAGILQPLEGRIQGAVAAAGDAATGVRKEISAEVTSLHSRLATAEAQATELRAVLDTTRQKLEDARAEARKAIDERDAEIASLQKVVQFHGDSLVELRERIREAGALVASGQLMAGQVPGAAAAADNAGRGGPAAGGGQAAGAAPTAAWATLLPDLANPDEAQRLTAVLELAETGDPAVAEYILPMLTDSDSFVRMVSVQGLGDLGYKPAVPHLIDRLGDERWTVREAARDALRTLTGKNFGFDPTARELEMKKRIEQWRAWWRREGDNFLTKG
ncbi:HEAT repeat protein [Planctomycetes bacterium Poly30]|uniref:HEAT repeat protein n=1 Tax=Saltatorellus ferox TaxID=2528018 RepID=A0A518EU69_9BACT|nr:HEAT repeat protein [Planctomycetes bacterium Poly30]